MKRYGFRTAVLAVAAAVVLTIMAIAPVTAYAATEDTIVYITNTGTKYHRQYCRTLSGKTSWPVTIAQARAQGLSTCGVCWPDSGYTAPATTVTSNTAPVTATTPATTATAPAATTTTITPAEAVQQAFAMYVQNGMDTNTALARTQAITAQLVTQPANVAQIVQNDLASLAGTVTAAATALTPAEAVQQAFALYVQNGLDTNTAFARTQSITAQLTAQPDAYAQFVQADLAALGK